MTCPACDCQGSEMSKWIKCENFDDSYLYKEIWIEKCVYCGHQFNRLSTEDLHNLTRYYIDEYAPANLSSDDKEGDKPGSTNEFTLKRYEQVEEFIMNNGIRHDSKVLDVGCATGGFLKHLKSKGFYHLYGIDMIPQYVYKAKNYNIRLGTVYAIPFEDNSFDIIILDQVLEHLHNPKSAMKEIKRVLKKGGLIYVGVPDADRYDDEYYWIMREHIQHFTLNSLKLLAQNNGFELIANEKNEFDMIGTLKLPNISALLKVSNVIYCWGIGREFFYLYNNTRLKDLYLIFIDDTPYKQKRKFKGHKINSSDVLVNADKDSFLIITAFVHKDKLIKIAKELGYRGTIIDV